VAIGIVQVINGWKWVAPAHLGKTSADIFLRHVFPKCSNVFHHVTVAVDDLMIDHSTHALPPLIACTSIHQSPKDPLY
jgi:hypothetical protein